MGKWSLENEESASAGFTVMWVQQAIFHAIRTDAALQSRIQSQFYLGRLPLSAKLTREQGAIMLAGETSVVGGSGAKEQMTFTFTLLAESHDLVETIAQDLDRLFHTTGRAIWRRLALQGPLPGQGRIRREFAGDVAEPGSELIHKVVRYRVLFAPAA